jgi:ADP-heptose:LPS heptosyltransferase
MANIFRKSYKKDKRGILRPTRKQIPVADRRGVPRTGSKTNRIERLKQKSKPISALIDHSEDAQVKICIQRRLGGIGDVIMTTPLVKALKEKYRNCEMTYATQPGVLSQLLEGNPYIDKVIDFQKAAPNHYHLFADVTTTGLSYEKATNPPKNRIDMFAEYVGVRLTDYKPIYVVSEKEQKWSSQVLEKWFSDRDQCRLIFLDIASVDQRRTWPVEHSVRLVGEINALRKDVRFVVNDFNGKLGREWDQEHCQDISKYGVRAKAALLDRCDLFIGPDSGFLHIAGALEKRIVAVFGSTPAAARINHYQNAIAVEAGLACQPCWYKQCNIKYKCLKDAEPFRVRDAALAKLDPAAPRPFELPVSVCTPTPADHESNTVAQHLVLGLKNHLEVNASLNPARHDWRSVTLDVIKTSLLSRMDYPVTPTGALKVGYLLVEESELSREAVRYITGRYDLLLTNTKDAMAVIAQSGISQPVYCVGMPIYRGIKLAVPSKETINVGCLVLDEKRGHLKKVHEVFAQIETAFPDARLTVLNPNEATQRECDDFWKNLNVFLDPSTNSSGMYAREAMLRGVLVVAPYNLRDVPNGMYYGIFSNESDAVFYSEIGTTLGKGTVFSTDDIFGALSDVLSTYDAQLELVPAARDWVIRNSSITTLRAMMGFIQQKLVNK